VFGARWGSKPAGGGWFGVGSQPRRTLRGVRAPFTSGWCCFVAWEVWCLPGRIRPVCWVREGDGGRVRAWSPRRPSCRVLGALWPFYAHGGRPACQPICGSLYGGWGGLRAVLWNFPARRYRWGLRVFPSAFTTPPELAGGMLAFYVAIAAFPPL